MMINNRDAKAILNHCDEVSQVLKSLSHPVRLKVLCQVIDQERTVNELTDSCGVSQSAMSQFLDRMREDKMVKSRREGTRVYYRIADQRLIRLFQSLRRIYCK